MSRAARLLLLALALAAPVFGEDLLKLPIGDPARKDRQAALVLDAVTDTASGALLTPEELAGRLAAARLVLVGEGHTEMDSHRVEKRVIEGLHRAGRRVLVGLEMYPYPEQAWLDQWSDGKLTEEAFLDGSHWYKNWGYNWLYYRDIFLFARDNHLRMFAINAPREVVSAVRKKGFQGLTPEEAAHIPTEIDTKNADHMRLFKANFEDASFHAAMTDEQWQGMLNAQCTWDATMGFNAVAPLRKDDDPKAVMVVLVGAGHVQYGLGIERQIKPWFSGKVASVIPLPVEDDKKAPVSSVQASFANFVWGIPAEGAPALSRPRHLDAASRGQAARDHRRREGLAGRPRGLEGAGRARVVRRRSRAGSRDALARDGRQALGRRRRGGRAAGEANVPVPVLLRREPAAPAKP